MHFRDLLIQHNVPFWAEGKDTRPGWIQLCCPKCRGERYLGFNLSGLYFHCWRCGHLPRTETAATLTGQPYSKVSKLFGDISAELRIALPKRGKLEMPYG